MNITAAELRTAALYHDYELAAEQRGRREATDLLRQWLRHNDGCYGNPCTCGLTAVVTILEVDPGSVAS